MAACALVVCGTTDPGPVITSSPVTSVAENTTLAHALTASEVVTWGLDGGPDLSQFELAGSTLRWIGNGTRDYELPTDSNTNNTYVIIVSATDAGFNTTLQTITVTVTDVDDTNPMITSGNTDSVPEATVLVHALTANETVTWSIVGGADAARFEISGSTLRWTGNGVKDFEAPNDADTNNSYVVTVRATDLASNHTDQTVTVTVADVNEFVWLNFAGGINLGMTLSDANTGLAPTTSAVAMSIATNGWKRSGKRYFEVVHTDVGVNGEGVGIVAEGAEIAKVTDGVHPTHCVAVSNVDGRIAARGYPSYPGASIGSVTTAGDRICFAVDLDNWRFWARKGAAGLWNNNAGADPATNVGGIDISYWASTRIAPMGMFFSTSFAAGAKWNFNFGDNTFSGAVPAGFIPGWDTGCETALGHPTYAYLDFHNTAGNAVIEKGGQLTVKPGSGTEIVHVGVANFKNSGKYYVEFEIIDYTGNSDLWGFVTHDTNDTEVQLGSNCSTVAAGSGAIRSNNASSGLSLGIRADGDIIGAAIDLDVDKVWFRVSPSGLWNGQAIGSQNPALNIGGVSISNYTAKGVGPGFCPANFTPPKFILNAGERAFSGAVPSGFTSGWPLNTLDTDPFWSDVVLLTGFERASGFTGTLLDDTNTHIIAINSGTANISAVQKKAGNTSLAVGTGGSSVPDHPSLDLSNANTDPFCIELSSYSSNFAGSHNQVYVQGAAGNQAIIIRHKLDGDITFFGSADGTNFWSVSTTGAPLANSVFQDVCYEKDTTGKLRIFVGGVMKGSATPADSSLFNSSAILALGDGAAAGTKHLDEIRVTKRVRYGSDSSYVPRFLPFPRHNATIWSPADVANVTLSGGNLVATGFAATGGVRSNKILKPGNKYYWEVTLTAVASNALACGIATANVTLSTAAGTTAGVAAVNRLANVFINGVNQGVSLGVPFPAGTVIGVAVDLLSNLIWFRVGASGPWNTSGVSSYNPADTTGGFYIGALTGSLHAFFATGGTGDAVTVNFGATAFVGAVPTGFIPLL